jgi:hypothetical protein
LSILIMFSEKYKLLLLLLLLVPTVQTDPSRPLLPADQEVALVSDLAKSSSVSTNSGLERANIYGIKVC